MALRSGFPLAAERPLYSELLNTRHEHDNTPTFLIDNTTRSPPLRARPPHPHSEGGPPSPRPSLLFAFRRLRDGCGARSPLLAFFGRGPAAVPSSLPDPVDSASGDPAPDSLGEGGGIGSYPLPSPGGRARSPWSTSRPHPRSLYRPRLAPPLRRLLFRLGEAWPSLPKITVARLPPRRVFPRWARTSRFHSQRPRQLISRPLRQLTPSPSRGPPVSALRLAGGPISG